MKNLIESLLETDHESLGQLLTDLDVALITGNIARAYELLDRFWAGLAVHIRAENLHLFPALASIPATSFNDNGSLPTFKEAQNVLGRLRSDHDFFMKELAETIKTMRQLVVKPASLVKQEIEEVRQRMFVISNRLKGHNDLEEEQAYTWPALFFDEPTIERLRERVRHELENLPPRFT